MAKKQYTFRTWSYTWYFQPSGDLFHKFLNFYKDQAIHLKDLWLKLSDDHTNRLNLSNFLEAVYSAPKSDIGFIISQVEECPSTSRLHLQGYVVFKNSVCRKYVLNTLNMPTIHVEPSHHDAATNIKYCGKCPTRVVEAVSFGVPPQGRGYRTDLVAVYEMATQLATTKEMLYTLGAAGMRHINLYQKTVQVLLEDDPQDQRILNLRATSSKALRDSLARFSVHGAHPAYNSDNDDDDDDDDDSGAAASSGFNDADDD